MHFNFTRLNVRYLSLLIFFISWQGLYSQTHTPRPTTISQYVGGYHEYLPINYDPSQSKVYPLIIFLHGSGEMGDGKSQLNSVLGYGLPNLIQQGQFPQTFTVNGVTHSFIVISPQFSHWPTAQDVQDVLNFIIPMYKVDQSRIYITGLSMGGGGTWDYAQSSINAASSIAAIVPVCAASDPQQGTPQVIGLANLPVWATHNDGDPVVPVSNTNNFIAAINATNPAPNPAAKKTIFDSDTHDAWTTTYDPNFRLDGMNVYEWMLQYLRSSSAALPVRLSEYKAFLLPDKAVAISWTTNFEENNAWFIIEHSKDGQNFQQAGRVKASNNSAGSAYKYIDRNPVSGSNFYRIKQIDVNGKITIFKILEVLLISPLSNTLGVYPNPVLSQLNIAIDNAQRGPLRLNIIDNNGKIITVRHFTKPDDYWQQSLFIGGLAPGHYILELKGNNFRSTRTFIKK